MLAADAETTSGCLRATAQRDPDRPAVEVGDEVLSYGGLDRRADELAARLLAELGPGDHSIGLRCAGTLPMVVGALGIARAGMVSVPLDPTAPFERIRVVLDDVDAPVVLADGDLGGDPDVPVADPLAHRAPVPAGGIDIAQGELASIVFTSGSTGTPKGIMVPRAHRLDLRRRLEHFEGIGDGARIGSLAAGTVGFAESLVHSVVQLGATLCAYEIRRLGTAPVAAWLRQSRVAGLVTVPTILRLLVASLAEGDVFEALRVVVLTGETATWEDLAALRPHLPHEAVVYNIFGLTETGAVAMLAVGAGTVADTGPLPAGRPLPYCKVTIVDEAGAPVPPGERGEIVVEGDDCTLGYWRRPELTALVYTELADGTRRVRTGDAGRLRADGVLEHLGRLDHVVKIAGNRVELGDVEVALRSLDGAAAAAAAPYSDASGSTRLTAFVVPQQGRELDPFLLRAALARRLPGAMLPDAIGILDELPQLASGKVDRRRLPERAEARPVASSAPTTALERDLAALWCAVLDVGGVGADDDFFELGGDSMRAARLFTEIERELGLDRPVALLLEAPTVRRLAAAIAADEETLGLLVPVRPEGTRAPLFVVHDGIGDVFYATRLSGHLGPDQPLYAIQPALVRSATAVETSIEQLAGRYLGEVRRVRPHGPYQLYGFSLGGLIAFEMARQLQAAGEQVAFLGLGDSSAPRLAWPHRARARLAEVRSLDAAAARERAAALAVAQLRHVAGLARSLPRRRRVPELVPLPALRVAPEERASLVLRHYGLMAYAYRPTTPFDGPVLLVRAGGPGGRPDRGWRAHVTGEIVVRDVDCGHSALGGEPFAREVAVALQEALGRVGTGSSMRDGSLGQR